MSEEARIKALLCQENAASYHRKARGSQSLAVIHRGLRELWMEAACRRAAILHQRSAARWARQARAHLGLEESGYDH